MEIIWELIEFNMWDAGWWFVSTCSASERASVVKIMLTHERSCAGRSTGENR